MASAISILTTQMVSAAVAAIDVNSLPIALPSGVIPTWSSGDPTVFTVSSATDPTGMTAVVTAVAVGSNTLTASATLASGTITGTATVTVTADSAGSLVITFGTPSAQ